MQNENNFILQAICELRFPTLFDLEDSRPPPSIAQALRKEFPNYEAAKDVILMNRADAPATVHFFRSRKLDWTVALRSSSILLECAKYTSFEDFHLKLGIVLKASQKVIDSDFFTRVGLRFVNNIDCSGDGVHSWINPAIVNTLDEKIFGTVKEFSGAIRGELDRGAFLFQHGFGHLKTNANLNSKPTTYILDFDFYCEDIEANDVLTIVDSLHKQQSSMFEWSLGDKARQFLTQPKSKK